jgi:hypothetical protein
MLKSHTLVPDAPFREIQYELRPARDPQGKPVPGLHNAWIVLNNPSQLNSYTTDMVKEVILAFRRATRPSAPAATPRSTPSTTPATRRSTSSTCGCSTA